MKSGLETPTRFKGGKIKVPFKDDYNENIITC